MPPLRSCDKMTMTSILLSMFFFSQSPLSEGSLLSCYDLSYGVVQMARNWSLCPRASKDLSLPTVTWVRLEADQCPQPPSLRPEIITALAAPWLQSSERSWSKDIQQSLTHRILTTDVTQYYYLKPLSAREDRSLTDSLTSWDARWGPLHCTQKHIFTLTSNLGSFDLIYKLQNIKGKQSSDTLAIRGEIGFPMTASGIDLQ
jgi:hypothetical protein